MNFSNQEYYLKNEKENPKDTVSSIEWSSINDKNIFAASTWVLFLQGKQNK